ncbi:hypothetical protein AK88_05394 [Plasmodium fragile]|uniref:AAA+ ATPase domain-containing protein n=1 Tax=Plasmodium fragile TaxID=5857 RepID=A0A0D9QGX0_PLAFR|nr:uncharacterized protein AK88_05394 [Plasmodium fragile]KJP84971.1 hypothetical protein AK88_05394 [Plasmodium fragile]
MRNSPNDKPPLENLCVQCNSNRTFSYLRREWDAEGSSRGASSNEYERTVLKKAIKYKWVKNLSSAECHLNVVEYLRRDERAEKRRGICEWRDEDSGDASSMRANTIGGEFHIVNKRFRKYEMHMAEAKCLERRSRRRFKPRVFVDGGCPAELGAAQGKGNHDGRVKAAKGGRAVKEGLAEEYLFNAVARAKYYRRVSNVWLRRFLRKSGPVYKRLAKQLINFLTIKNFHILDVELWNLFFKKKVTNHMNTNLYFFLGKKGSEKEKFLADLFLSFPFTYASDRVYVVDIDQCGRCPIVSDCRYAVHSMGTLNWADSGVESSGKSSARSGARKRRPYVNKIMYPNLSQIIQKEEAVRGLTQRRGCLQDIDPCNENLEYILLAVTRIALVKQFVSQKQLLRRVSILVESSRRRKRLTRRGEGPRKCSPRVAKEQMDKRTRGLNLFNGGHSFLLIKNLNKLNDMQMPPLRKSCIVQVLLKYVYLWKELNLNVHAFVLGPEGGRHTGGVVGGATGPHGVNPFSEFLSNCATFEFPTFELPPFLREAQRRQYLAHLFKQKGVKCYKGDLQQVAEVTTSFSKADLGKLCRDECRERFVHAMRPGGEVVRNGFVGRSELLNQLEKSRGGDGPHGGVPAESNFFHKTLNLHSESSHAVIRTHEIELYKGEKRGGWKKVPHIGEAHGLDNVIAEEELVSKVREEVVRFFMSTCKNGHAEPPTGILLYGKSGSGKTFLAQKIINECNCTSLVINCSNLFNKVMGESEKFLNDIFVYAQVRVGPCIILFEGIENICYNSKGYSSHGISKFMQRVKLCFYQHLDKIHFQNKWGLDRRTGGKILIIATTTDLTNVDANLLLQHRLRHVYCTKEFHLWRDSDVLKLVQSCLQRCNVHEDNFVLSVELQNFFRKCVLSRKGKLTPLCVSNLCRDAVARHVRRVLACAGREPNDRISVEDFIWAAKNANS